MIKNQNYDKSSQTSHRAQTMEELLSAATTSFVSLKKGSIVDGIITKLSPSEILVDIGSKTEAVVLEKDRKILSTILSNLKLGDKIKVSILNPESDNGNSVVSLRRFMGDLVWEKLEAKKKNGSALDAVITAETRGGFLIDAAIGISGFLPNSQTQPNNKIGDKLKVFVLDLNRDEHRVIFSQRPVLNSREFEELSSKLKIGVKVEATITNIAPFGIFTSIKADGKNLDGFIHISEIAWERLDKLDERFKSGDRINAIVIGFDQNSRRINLSLKLLTADPFERVVAEKFPVDTKIKATVTRITSTGVIFDLEEVTGIIKKESIPVGTTYRQGDSVEVTVSKIDKKKRRIILVPVLLEKPIGYR